MLSRVKNRSLRPYTVTQVKVSWVINRGCPINGADGLHNFFVAVFINVRKHPIHVQSNLYQAANPGGKKIRRYLFLRNCESSN